MRTPWTMRLLVGAVVTTAGLLWLQSSWGQGQPPTDEYDEAKLEFEAELKQLEKAKRDVIQAKQRVAADAWRVKKDHGRMDPKSGLRQAAEALRDAEDDESKAEAEIELRELLSSYFDEDLVRRAAELEAIEKRVRTLRSQLQRRGNHKPEIIDLQVKVLVNEADGLGFFSNTEPNAFIFAPGGNPFQITSPRIDLQLHGQPHIEPIAAPVPVNPPAPPREPKPALEASPRANNLNLNE